MPGCAQSTTVRGTTALGRSNLLLRLPLLRAALRMLNARPRLTIVDRRVPRFLAVNLLRNRLERLRMEERNVLRDGRLEADGHGVFGARRSAGRRSQHFGRRILR